MKLYILFLLIILASCNDGGSDPEFVKTKTEAKVSAKPLYKIGDSLNIPLDNTLKLLDSLRKQQKEIKTFIDSLDRSKQTAVYPGFYSGDSTRPYPSLRRLSRKKNKLPAADLPDCTTGVKRLPLKREGRPNKLLADSLKLDSLKKVSAYPYTVHKSDSIKLIKPEIVHW